MAENHTPNGRLDSWKDIASYLDRDVRTVMRWEEKGLPVHRVPGGKRQAVFAYPAEIDDWLHGKGNNGLVIGAELTAGENSELAQPVPVIVPLGTTPSSPKWLLKYSGLAVLALFLMFGAVGAIRFPKSGSPVQITKLTRLSRDGLFKTGLVTDGANLYFSEYGDGKIQLSSMRVDGGPVSHISTPFAKALVEDIYPDGRELLVRGRDGTEYETELWIVPVNGQPAKRAGQILCHAASISPDGKVIAYSRGNSIFLSLDEGATSHELHQFESDPYDLHWFEPGNHLRFALRNSATRNFSPWEIGFGDHFDVRAISRLPLVAENCCLGWVDTPDYEFFTAGSRDENRIWALPQQRHWWQAGPVQSVELGTPLGSLTALASDVRPGRLFMIGAQPDRGEFVRFEPFSATFAPYLPGVSGLYLDFSRDGKWITYTALDDGTLWISRSDGSEKRRLTALFTEVELPRWSPDGTQIAFAAKKAGHPWRIYAMAREGGTPLEVSSGNDNQGAPTWSPDGKWLAYANVECQESHSCAVHRVELSTGKVETLPESAGLRTARWSPDGRYIAALLPARHQLLVFNVGKQSWTKLADSIMGDDLSWSHDSRYLYSNRPLSDKPAIFRVPVTGGKQETVADLGSLVKLSGKSDVGLCVAPDNSIVLLRQINSSEIYALDWRAQ